MRVQFDIPGKPFAKQRPRATARGGFARVYTPKETVSFERVVGQIAAPLFAAPIVGPVRLTIVAVFEPPPSWSKKKRAAHLHRPHLQKPDLDNCAKAIKDALNRIAWGDDAQVSEMHVSKVWGNRASTAVWVEAIEDQQLVAAE